MHTYSLMAARSLCVHTCSYLWDTSHRRQSDRPACLPVAYPPTKQPNHPACQPTEEKRIKQTSNQTNQRKAHQPTNQTTTTPKGPPTNQQSNIQKNKKLTSQTKNYINTRAKPQRINVRNPFEWVGGSAPHINPPTLWVRRLRSP